jgi:hypothetical protein
VTRQNRPAAYAPGRGREDGAERELRLEGGVPPLDEALRGAQNGGSGRNEPFRYTFIIGTTNPEELNKRIVYSLKYYPCR